MTIQENTRAAFYAKLRRENSRLPAYKAWIGAKMHREQLDLLTARYGAAEKALKDRWELLGKVEPKRHSDAGRELQELRTAAHRARTRRTEGMAFVIGEPFTLPRDGMTWQKEPGHLYIENPESFFRVTEGDTQFYTDRDGHGHNNVRPVVAQLPGRNGMTRHVAGYQFMETDNGGATFDFSHIWESENPGYRFERADSERDAMAAGEQMAEEMAEAEMEYQTAWRAGSDWAELKEVESATRAELLELLAERRAAPVVELPAICAALRNTVSDLLTRLYDSRAKRAELANGDNSEYYFYPDERLSGAFNEGAGDNVI